MAVLFFNLRDVPLDEADDIRQLLTEHEIGFYETSAGNWGISTAAIWLYDADDLEQARALCDAYQAERAETQRELYRLRKLQGEHAGFWRHNLSQPLRFLSYSTLIAVVGYASVKWLFDLGL